MAQIPANIGQGEIFESMMGDLFNRVLTLDPEGTYHPGIPAHIALQWDADLAGGGECVVAINTKTMDRLQVIRPGIDIATSCPPLCTFEGEENLPRVLFRIIEDDLFYRPYKMELENHGVIRFSEKLIDVCFGGLRHYVARDDGEPLIIPYDWGTDDYRIEATNLAECLELPEITSNMELTPERIIGDSNSD